MPAGASRAPIDKWGRELPTDWRHTVTQTLRSQKSSPIRIFRQLEYCKNSVLLPLVNICIKLLKKGLGKVKSKFGNVANVNGDFIICSASTGYVQLLPVRLNF